MSIRVLHYQEGNSDKIWAYDSEKGMSYYGRRTNSLTERPITYQVALKRIGEKKNKGYQEASHMYTIEDGALVSVTMVAQTSTDWLVGFNGDDVTGDELAEYLWNLTAPEYNCEISQLISALRNQKSSVTISKPNAETRLVLASIIHKYPVVSIYNEQNQNVSKSELLAESSASRDDLLSLELIQDIKTFKTPPSGKGAYF